MKNVSIAPYWFMGKYQASSCDEDWILTALTLKIIKQYTKIMDALL